MAEPKLEEYMLPVLKSFADQDEHKHHEVMESLSDAYDLLQRDRSKRAMLMVNASVGYMLKARLLEKTAEKTFKITDLGSQLLETSPESISVKDLRQFKEFDDFIVGRYKKVALGEQSPDVINELPEDRMESSYEVYKAALANDILEKVKQCSWQFFEVLVKELLVAMGYGDPFDEAKMRKGPGDEGIDGVIKEDRLGLSAICLQAKKWENTVGRPEIQKFAGSLESRRVKKGVFITTSTFSHEACEYVDLIEKKIILIDGPQLADLMIDYGVGVSDYKTYNLRKIDTDYFDA